MQETDWRDCTYTREAAQLVSFMLDDKELQKFGIDARQMPGVISKKSWLCRSLLFKLRDCLALEAEETSEGFSAWLAHCLIHFIEVSDSFHGSSRHQDGIEWRSRWQFQLPAAIANGIVRRMESGDMHGGGTAV